MCVVRGPAQGAMAKTKNGKEESKPKKNKKGRAPPEDQHPRTPYFEPCYEWSRQINKKAEAESRALSVDPPSRPLNEESSSRALNEDPPSR